MTLGSDFYKNNITLQRRSLNAFIDVNVFAVELTEDWNFLPHSTAAIVFPYPPPKGKCPAATGPSLGSSGQTRAHGWTSWQEEGPVYPKGDTAGLQKGLYSFLLWGAWLGWEEQPALQRRGRGRRWGWGTGRERGEHKHPAMRGKENPVAVWRALGSDRCQGVWGCMNLNCLVFPSPAQKKQDTSSYTTFEPSQLY